MNATLAGDPSLRIVIKTRIEMGSETKSAYTLVEDNHYIMHSYTILYARSTCLCIKQDSRWQISLHGAYRLVVSRRPTLKSGSGEKSLSSGMFNDVLRVT